MKRMLLTALAGSMLALSAPAVATAHHRHHHARSHKGHAKTSRLVRFGATSVLAPATNTPTTPIEKPAPEKETAGTVESFTGGVLTIKLTSGEKVSGKVTEETQIHCHSSTPETSDNDDENSGGNDEGGSEGDEHGSSSSSSGFAGQHGDFMAHSACENSENCTTAALVPGAVVLAAELKLGSGGAVWDRVDLVH